MPRLPLTVMLYADRAVFLTISYLGQFLYYCFIGAIVLGRRRGCWCWAGWRSGIGCATRSSRAASPDDGARRCTVLIPAFNEEKVIVTTVERILASDYPQSGSAGDR